MKMIFRFAILAIVVAAFSACEPGGLVIEGQVTNAADLDVFIDEVRLGKASIPLEKVTADANGNFAISFEEGLPSGIYNVRIGAKRVNLVLDGSEQNISLNGDLENLQTYNFTVAGSSDSYTLTQVMQSLFRREYKVEDVTAFVDTVGNPHLGAFVAYTALGNNGQFVAVQQKAAEKLTLAYPDSEASAAYTTYVGNMKQKAASQASRPAGPIQVGMAAPDIRLSSPNGTEYALSDLRGQVVLLDFWASWCGPCRRENPSVVDVYNRYKSQGFTVYSVSLDGLDTRSKARYKPEDMDRAMEGQKQRWVNAIQQDGLVWDYHVSDLKKWESDAGRSYGVSSIPRTFLIDRDGKVAAVNLRGAAAIEQALKQVI